MLKIVFTATCSAGVTFIFGLIRDYLGAQSLRTNMEILKSVQTSQIDPGIETELEEKVQKQLIRYVKTRTFKPTSTVIWTLLILLLTVVLFSVLFFKPFTSPVRQSVIMAIVSLITIITCMVLLFSMQVSKNIASSLKAAYIEAFSSMMEGLRSGLITFSNVLSGIFRN